MKFMGLRIKIVEGLPENFWAFISKINRDNIKCPKCNSDNIVEGISQSHHFRACLDCETVWEVQNEVGSSSERT
jgi:RNA polymerase subunit RPABC4/transcription elongation factor Spt4